MSNANQDEHSKDHIVKVQVVHVNETEKASFDEPDSVTLQKVWDDAYTYLDGVTKKERDVFQTGGEHPKSLMNYLGLTLMQAREQHVISEYHFGIASETGGAASWLKQKVSP